MHELWITFVANTGTTPQEGLAELGAFFLAGCLLAWGNPRMMRVGSLAQFVYLTMAIRYIGSYLVYHHSLVEGVYPILWGSAALVGVALCRPRKK